MSTIIVLLLISPLPAPAVADDLAVPDDLRNGRSGKQIEHELWRHQSFCKGHDDESRDLPTAGPESGRSQ